MYTNEEFIKPFFYDCITKTKQQIENDISKKLLKQVEHILKDKLNQLVLLQVWSKIWDKTRYLNTHE